MQGTSTLDGAVRVGGFKHALVPLLAASVLARGRIELENVPRVEDTRVLASILRSLGANVDYEAVLARLSVDASALDGTIVSQDLSALVHGPVYLLPVLLARFGTVSLGRTGGCRIGPASRRGERPLAHLLDVLGRFGADVRVDGDRVCATCGRLRGATIDLRDFADAGPGGPTGPLYSGATKCAVLAAAGAHGTTVLSHPYPKPDVTMLLDALVAAGVDVDRDRERLAIRGTGDIGTFRCKLVPDLIEIVTFVAAAVHTGSPLRLESVAHEAVADGLRSELAHLEEMGVGLRWSAGGLDVQPPEVVGPVDIAVQSHGLFSDSHPFFTLMLLGATGTSRISENVWTDRFAYVDPLRRVGADLRVSAATVEVRPSRLMPATTALLAGDLRTAAVLLIAALGVDGPTTIHGTDHLARGYDDLVGKLRSVGARIDNGARVT